MPNPFSTLMLPMDVLNASGASATPSAPARVPSPSSEALRRPLRAAPAPRAEEAADPNGGTLAIFDY